MTNPVEAQPGLLHWNCRALVLLGSLSGLLGRIYGQVPALIPTLVAVLAVLMGLNLLGIIRIPLPAGPVPTAGATSACPLAPVAAGLAFGVAASPAPRRC